MTMLVNVLYPVLMLSYVCSLDIYGLTAFRISRQRNPYEYYKFSRAICYIAEISQSKTLTMDLKGRTIYEGESDFLHTLF
jgi:hypothetical protein